MHKQLILAACIGVKADAGTHYKSDIKTITKGEQKHEQKIIFILYD